MSAERPLHWDLQSRGGHVSELTRTEITVLSTARGLCLPGLHFSLHFPL